MPGWTFSTTRSLVCEAGAAKRVGEILRGLGARKAFVVTDPGVLGAGLLQPGLDSLRAAGIEHLVYSDTTADPAAQLVLDAAALAKADGADCVLGFGGGSSMDIAKMVALMAQPSSTQPLSDMYGVGNVVGERLPLVQVPTTAGTGSEVTPISILTTGAEAKAGIVAPQLLPDVAILDGEMTTSLPAHVAAATGIDAMVHAIEAFTSAAGRKNPLSDLLGREALRLLGAHIDRVCEPASVGVATDELAAARTDMLLGSCYAGMAFANAPVGAVHALAYPLGSIFHVAHGLPASQSNSLVLPYVLDFNAAEDAALQQYAELAPIIAPALRAAPSDAARVSGLVEHFHALPKALGLPTRLSEVGVTQADVARLASEAMKQTRLLPNNPRLVTLDDAVRIYQAAL